MTSKSQVTSPFESHLVRSHDFGNCFFDIVHLAQLPASQVDTTNKDDAHRKGLQRSLDDGVTVSIAAVNEESDYTQQSRETKASVRLADCMQCCVRLTRCKVKQTRFNANCITYLLSVFPQTESV